MNNQVLIHYGELALKGRNRGYFENKLKENIRLSLAGEKVGPIQNLGGRFLLSLKSQDAWPIVADKLNRVFGLSSFSLCESLPLEIEAMKEAAVKLLKDKEFSTFAVRSHRANKNFKLTSIEIDREIGGAVFDVFSNIKVNLKNPDVFLYLEVLDKQVLLYTDKNQGAGGLPVGTSGKTLTLISGGIDSPVAAWQMMKRGLAQDFIHFHSYPFTNKASQEKVKRLVKEVNSWQNGCRLYLVPLFQIQKEIVAKTPSALRVVLYRRFMVRLAQRLAQDSNCAALVTGENLGQVASQTLANISVIQEAVKLVIFRPLIGLDKQEIINKAEKIKTYPISIEPDQDCCSYLMPRQPVIRATLNEVLCAEKELAKEELLDQALSQVETIKF